MDIAYLCRPIKRLKFMGLSVDFKRIKKAWKFVSNPVFLSLV